MPDPLRMPLATFRIAGLATCAFVALASSPPALAGGREARERMARKACLEGDYAKGVSVLSDLFLDTNDPTYIYNQGRCFEQNGRFSDAILRFQEYLRVGGPKLHRSDKADADKHIADCQGQLAQRTSEPEPIIPATKSVAPVFAAQAQAAVPPPSAAMITQPPMPPAKRNGSVLRVAGLATAGVGAAGVITGAIFNLKANSIADGYGTRGSYTQSRENERSTYETVGWAGYGVGSACVVAGSILYLWGRSAGNEASANVALVPSVGPGSAGALLSGAF